MLILENEHTTPFGLDFKTPFGLEPPTSQFPCFRWIKPGGFQSIAVVGPDVIALHSCSYILFFPPDGPRIDYEASTKANGLGVQCLAGYVAAPLFAFAEKAATKPRLLVKSFPGFETISVLSGK